MHLWNVKQRNYAAGFQLRRMLVEEFKPTPVGVVSRILVTMYGIPTSIRTATIKS